MLSKRKIILASILAGLTITICVAFYTESYSEYIQKGIAGEVIRFHVLANSNSDEDQSLKLKVRDGILAEFEEELSQAAGIGDTRSVILDNMEKIEFVANKIIEENGGGYEASVCLTEDYFPTKKYGDVVFPAGQYEALRIEIGEASGNNWWCVMFPPLCYVDVSVKEVPNDCKEELKRILTEEEYSILLSDSEGDITPKIKFKVVEIWQKIQNNF